MRETKVYLTNEGQRRLGLGPAIEVEEVRDVPGGIAYTPIFFKERYIIVRGKDAKQYTLLPSDIRAIEPALGSGPTQD